MLRPLSVPSLRLLPLIEVVRMRFALLLLRPRCSRLFGRSFRPLVRKPVRLQLLFLYRPLKLLPVVFLVEILVQPHAVVKRDELGPVGVPLNRLASPQGCLDPRVA